MKLRSLLLLAGLAGSLNAAAQTPSWVMDSVQMGTGYGNDIFYSMKNGTAKSESNTNWTLAFEMIPGGPVYHGVSVLANHVQGGVSIYSIHQQGSTKFGSLTSADTATMTQLYNSDSSWDYGAFNENYDPTDMFSFGWGKYNSTNHNIYGDSVYLIKAGGVNYQMWIDFYKSYPYDSIYYSFHIAKFDGSNRHDDTIHRNPTYMDRNFAYYDIATNSFLDREPAQTVWDILFTRYIEYVSLGGPVQPYPVMGVLSNRFVAVADVRGVNPDTTVSYNKYTRTLKLNEIGSDWKAFNMTTFAYDIDTTATFFVQTVDSAVYQIKFTAFHSASDPNATGRVVFAKRMWAFPADVKNVNNTISQHIIAPNPATTEANIVLTAKESTTAQLVITDIAGRLIQNNTININQGLNAFKVNTSGFANGTYLVNITNGSWKVSNKLSVQH